MSETCRGLRVGQAVPDFKIETFEPTENFFGERSLEILKKEGKWTILFSTLLILRLSEQRNLLIWQVSMRILKRKCRGNHCKHRHEIRPPCMAEGRKDA